MIRAILSTYSRISIHIPQIWQVNVQVFHLRLIKTPTFSSYQRGGRIQGPIPPKYATANIWWNLIFIIIIIIFGLLYKPTVPTAFWLILFKHQTWYVSAHSVCQTRVLHQHGSRHSAAKFLHTHVHTGRNFGLKSGGTSSERERSALGSRGERRGEWGGSTTLGSGSTSRTLLEGQKRFYCNLNSADRLCWQHGYYKFFTFLSWKVRVRYPSVQKVGIVGTPRTPCKLRLCWPEPNHESVSYIGLSVCAGGVARKSRNCTGTVCLCRNCAQISLFILASNKTNIPTGLRISLRSHIIKYYVFSWHRPTRCISLKRRTTPPSGLRTLYV